MSTIEKIREFLKSQANDKLLTSRDFLKFGPRSAVDNAVSNLIKRKELKRVCRGVFSLPGRHEAVSVLEIATVKAQSFGRKIISDSAAFAKKHGLVISAANNDHYFTTDGRSSKFRFGDLVIHFVATSLRKFSLGDCKLGRALRGLCLLGARMANPAMIKLALTEIENDQLKELPSKSTLLPSWLSDQFHGQVEKLVSTNNDKSSLDKSKLVGESPPLYDFSRTDSVTCPSAFAA